MPAKLVILGVELLLLVPYSLICCLPRTLMLQSVFDIVLRAGSCSSLLGIEFILTTLDSLVDIYPQRLTSAINGGYKCTKLIRFPGKLTSGALHCGDTPSLSSCQCLRKKTCQIGDTMVLVVASL